MGCMRFAAVMAQRTHTRFLLCTLTIAMQNLVCFLFSLTVWDSLFRGFFQSSKTIFIMRFSGEIYPDLLQYNYAN